MQALIIGIAGGSGSGKTTLIRNIKSKYGENIAILNMDSYYKKHDELTYDERCTLNYDHPDAFDVPLFCDHINSLKHGEAVLQPVYDYTVHNRSKDTTLTPSTNIIIIDGILLLHDERIRRLLDIKLYVDAEPDVRLVRRIRRDMKYRGRSIESITSQYINTVKPMHDKFVEPSKQHADMIILHGGKNEAAFRLVCGLIDSAIK